MSEVSVNITMEEGLRDSFKKFCANIGMSVSAAVSVFASQAVRLQKIPFEISADLFYSEANIRMLEKAASDVASGRASLTAYELIDN